MELTELSRQSRCIYVNGNSREICLSMRKIRLRGRVEIACACGKFKKLKIYEKMRAAFLLYFTLYKAYNSLFFSYFQLEKGLSLYFVTKIWIKN